MHRNILITGSKGQLGHEIQALANAYSDFSFFYTDVDELDITDFSLLESFILTNSIDTIINCAAYTAVDMAEDENELALRVNAEATRNLAKVTELINGQLIHVSTDYVFKGLNYTPYAEDESTDPINFYGLSKLRGEEAIMELPINAQIIRTSWLYSSFGNNFVKTILRVAKERNELKVVFDQIGTPTYAGDLAKAILDILNGDKIIENKPSIFHYSNEGVASWFDFAQAIVESSDLSTNVLPVRSAEFPTKANRPNYSVLDKSKIKSEYNIEIPYWRDSLKLCIEKLKNHE